MWAGCFGVKVGPTRWGGCGDGDGETRAFDVLPIDQRTLVSPVLDGRSDAGHRRGLCPDLVSPSVAGTGADAADHPAGLASRSVVHRLVAIVRDPGGAGVGRQAARRSEEHTSELQSLMRISYAVFCLKKKNLIYSQLLNIV